MRKIIQFTIIAALSSICIAGMPAVTPIEGTSTCQAKESKKDAMKALNPFYYASAKVNQISYDYKQTVKEIEVPLFKGEKYKFVFNKSGLPKDVVIEVYDKSKDHDNRKVLFSSKDSSDDIVTYEPEKSKKMYVNYVVPPAKGEENSGCIVFIVGYQLTFLD